MTLSPQDVAKNWFEVVWNQGRREAITQLLAPDVTFHDGGTDSRGIEPFLQFYDRIRSTLSQIHVEVEDTIVEGERVCVRWRSKAIHTGDGLGIPPSGAEIEVTGISVVHVVDGRFVEAWQNWDMLGLMEQIGGQAKSPTYVTA
jgi:steroid delta-isomerase-like uncharacterized protein